MTRVDLDADFTGLGLEGTEIFEVEVPSRGILAVEATAPIGAAARTKLASLDDDCRPVAAAPGAIETYVSGTVLEISAPGTYRFAVASQNPFAVLEAYRFTTRFASWEDLCAGAPPAAKTLVEPEPEPDLGWYCLSRTLVEPEPEPDLGKTLVEPEPEPDLGKTLVEAEPEPDLGKTLVEPEPEPDLLGLTASALCSKGEKGDHGDIFACATRLDTNASVSGRLSHRRGGDADVFRFTLKRQATVVIEVVTRDELSLAVYDVHGLPLEMKDLDGGPDHVYVATLVAGSYHLRLDGAGSPAAYRLSVTEAGW